MLRLLTQIKWFLRYYGLSGVIPMMISKCLRRNLKRYWVLRKDRAFDRRFNVTTVGIVAVSDLDIEDQWRRQAVEYTPTPGAGLGVVLDELAIDHRQFTFMDFGAGMGRALFMAAAFPFARVTGIELSCRLAGAACDNIARCNLSRLKCHHVDCVQASATMLELPQTPLVLYFFNPFGADVLFEVLERVKASWACKPREIVAVYCNPVHRVLFEESEFWQKYRLQYGTAPSGWAVYAVHTNPVHNGVELAATSV